MTDITPNTSERNEIQLAVMTEKVSNIDESVKKIDANLVKLESKIDGHYATKGELSETRRDVADLKDNQRWLVRAIIGTVVAAVLAAIGLQMR